MNVEPIIAPPTPEYIAFHSPLNVNIRRCEQEDLHEWRRAHNIQRAIDANLIEYEGYGAGVATYRLTLHGKNVYRTRRQ